MKYVSIVRLAPGVDNMKRAFEVFGKQGNVEGTTALYAATDGKTFIGISESDAPDMAGIATYAPFFESNTTFPVVDVDDAWVEAMITAIDRMDG